MRYNKLGMVLKQETYYTTWLRIMSRYYSKSCSVDRQVQRPRNEWWKNKWNEIALPLSFGCFSSDMILPHFIQTTNIFL